MNILAIDIESSGYDPKKNALLEIAAIPIINGVKGEPFVSYVRPHKDAVIEPKALEINKLTYDQIWTFPEPTEVIKSFLSWIDSKETMFNLLGHNVQFDRRFLYSFFCRYGGHGDFITRFRPNDICTEDMARVALKHKPNAPKSVSLGNLCKYFDIKLDNAHSALPDIEATYELYQILKAAIPDVRNPSINLSYQEKRQKYLDMKYIQFNSGNDIFITKDAVKDPNVMRFIAEELYHLYGG